MDNVLFVMNMQELYAGKNRNKDKYPFNAEDLTDKVNKCIAMYQPEEVFYIKSIGKGLFKGALPKEGSKDAEFVTTMKVVSKNIYEKSKPDCFTNDSLHDFIRARNVKNIEFVGVDTGEEIGRSAFTATEDMNIKVVYNELAIIMMSPDKAAKYREKLRKTRVTFKQDWEEN
ncbi:MAG: isochorismatase family protein [Ruminococcus sp.]|nr:isochorismatase family protein [Ruminococcus sp.]